MAKKIIAIFITGTATALTILLWGEPESYGWLCAAAGWIDKCFKE